MHTTGVFTFIFFLTGIIVLGLNMAVSGMVDV